MRLCIAVGGVLVISAPVAAAERIPVPSDPKAEYVVLERGGDESHPTLTTQRTGSSGVTFSRRVFDCSAGTAKYLGTGPSLEAMNRSPSDPNMTPVLQGSIAYHLMRYACEGK